MSTHIAFGLEISKKSFVWGCNLTYVPFGSVTFFTLTMSPSCKSMFSIICIWKQHQLKKLKTQSRTILVKQAYTYIHKQLLLNAYPVWHVYHAFLSNELQNPTMRNPLGSIITEFKQHWVINMQRCCKLNLMLEFENSSYIFTWNKSKQNKNTVQPWQN